MKEMLPVIIPGLFALGGVLLSSLLDRWRRKEQRVNMLFNKRVESYSYLVRKAHEILVESLLENKEEAVLKGGVKLIREFGEQALFASADVGQLTLDFATTAANLDMEIDDKRDKLGVLYRELSDRCQQELGMPDLEKDFVKQ